MKLWTDREPEPGRGAPQPLVEADERSLLRVFVAPDERCRELSRRFILVSDLRGGPLLRAGVSLLTATVFREPMTRHDARLSAVRAFSFPEMHDLALRAGWASFRHKKFAVARHAIWLEKR